MVARDLGTPADLMDAVLQVVDRDGFRRAEPLNPTGAARAAGVSRGTIYAHWPTTPLLNGDVLRFAVTEHPGWQRRILAAPADADLRSLVLDLLAKPHGEVGLVFRCTAAQLTEEYDVAEDITEWERSWVSAFDTWVLRHLAASGRALRPEVGPLEVALALTSLIEGALLGAVLVHGPFYTGWSAEARAAVADVAASVVEQASRPLGQDVEEGAGAAAPDEVPALPAVPHVRPDRWADGTLDLLSSLFYGLLREQVVAGRPAPAVRLVDPDALAAHLGVSRRRVFQVWESAAECNADVLDALAARYEHGCTEAMVRAVEDLLADPPPDDRAVTEALFASILLQLDRSGRRSLLECALATRDPVVLARSAEAQRRLATGLRPHQLALVQALRRGVRPGLTLADVTGLLGSVVLGAGRLLNNRVPDAASPDERAAVLARSLWLVVDGMLAPWPTP